MTTNILLLAILIVLVLILLELAVNFKVFRMLGVSKESDLSLVDEIVQYIDSKGLSPTFVSDETGMQFFAYIDKASNEIITLFPVDNLNYKKNSKAWKIKKAELIKKVDEAMEDQS